MNAGFYLTEIERPRRTDAELRAPQVSSALLSAALDVSGDVVLFVRPSDFRLLAANETACEVLGHTRDEIAELELAELVPGDACEALYQAIAEAVGTIGLRVDHRTVLRRAAGTQFPVELAIRAIADADDDVAVVVAGRDATEPQRTVDWPEQRDAVTGLTGRRALERPLDEAARKSRDDGYLYALCMIDVDRFKQINDKFGHRTGDLVLKVLAGRLVACLRTNDVVVRYGGDEFVVFVDDVRSRAEVRSIAERMLKAIADPIALEGRQLTVSASLGIALGRGDKESSGDLLHRADMRMYRAKSLGRDGRFVMDDR